MALKTLKMPSDSSSEIFFNSQSLSVEFRKKQKAPEKIYNRMLRVIVQAYGYTVEDRFFKPGTTVTFGTKSGNTFRIAIPNLPEHHPLMTYHDDGKLTLKLSSHFSGILQMGEKLSTLSELQKNKGGSEQVIEIVNHPRGAIEQGTIRIYFEEIDDPEKIAPIPFIRTLADREFGRWLMVSLALHLLLLLLIKILPTPVEDKKIEDLPKEFQKILIQPKEVKPYQPVIVSNSLSQQNANNNPSFAQQSLRGGGREGEGARAPGAEGKRGGAAVKKPSMEKVKNAGVLSFFAQGGKSGGLNDLVDGSVKDLADNLAKSSRYGMETDESRQGKGIVNNATGGGGQNTTSLDSGLSTKGRGGGAKGDGLADLGTGKSRTAVIASIDAESATVVGSLSKEQIARVINSYMGQIQYCYERQLQREPKLRGKILVKFVIGLSGSVTSAETQSSTMGSPPVETCVNGVFRRMPFPSPGAGIVEAVYPLVFNVAG